MPRYRSRQIETESVNPRLLRRGAVKRQHLTRWSVGNQEIAPGVIGETHLGPNIINETHIHPDTTAALTGSGQVLVLEATAVAITSGGDYLPFETILAQHGFAETAAAGESWIHPVTGVYVLDYEHAWDTYEDGGTIELELDGTVPADGVIGSAAEGITGRATIVYLAREGAVGKIKITQSSGSSKTCDATVKVGISDVASIPEADWTTLFAADAWDITSDGADWWISEGPSGQTVSKLDGDGTVLFTFEADEVEGTGSGVRGITFDGTNLWVTGFGAKIAKYSTAGSLVSSWTGIAEQVYDGIAWDGTDLWVVHDDLVGMTFELLRYTTAGSLQQTITLPSGPNYAGLAYHEGRLYIIDTTNSDMIVVDPAGTLLGTIDLSAVVASPTGVYVDAGDTLYISKDADNVYRRRLPLGGF